MQATPARETPAYNATVVQVRRVHAELLILRVIPDDGIPAFEPGQYTTLGLCPEASDSAAVAQGAGLIRRAYSLSSPLLDESGALVRPADCGFLEFLVALVPRTSDSPPSLTPLLFALQPGDRLHAGLRPRGTYTLAPVTPDDDVLFAATGTGEAPHNTMLAELLSRGHRGRIASFVCVRQRRDLAYLSAHRRLESRYDTYQYLPLTTREPENTDQQHPHYVGRQHLQDVFSGDRLEQVLGWQPEPHLTHIFVCGNPAMIGIPRDMNSEGCVFPDPRGMLETLDERGFELDRHGSTGRVHYEKYW